MKVKPRFGTHLAALTEACARSTGPIIEVGAGTYSTPALLEIAKASGRDLVTVERHDEWVTPFVDLAVQLGMLDRYHVTRDLETGLAAFDHYGVALVDGEAAERAPAVLALLPKCDYIVVHDTERLGDYAGLAEAIATARYRHDFTDVDPWTSVLSDVIEWEQPAR